MQANQAPWWVFPGLATLIMVVFAGAITASCFFEDGTLRTQMFTGALGLATMAASYYFGSSAGSAKKDDTIASSSEKKDQTIAASISKDAP